MKRDRKSHTFHLFDAFFAAADLFLIFDPMFSARFVFTHPSPAQGPKQKHPENTPHSSTQFYLDPAISPSNPDKIWGKVRGLYC